MEVEEQNERAYKQYEVSELEGDVLNLGEREWGVTDNADAVFAYSLDTCALVVVYDMGENSRLVGAVHYRSPAESAGALAEITHKMKDKGAEDLKAGVVWGRLANPRLDKNSLAIRAELLKSGLGKPEQEVQGVNGVFMSDTKKIDYSQDTPPLIKRSIREHYRQKVAESA